MKTEKWLNSTRTSPDIPSVAHDTSGWAENTAATETTNQ